ncbi:aldehyde ferredoxin oxidoreductase family protein [Wolinella succinogenes]|uniref:ALDEHYDE FERREDOXIN OXIDOREDUCTASE n=1 Tax=Wolinella succinogenes (strain ATCC 29543 / DSM 1740 / CCUG 13145 / JCM 31913 / LMG 7466 / NCTC 11488 / FDC 602W) TaxID=273121 RepID=Q7M866_WOLSU|nr:aldehyde ferredoxin oxidoreductase C-terminal domain-containing protein [Wolinella succinogenes]NLU33763.1 aldehyde ferredoxin oxidoreductase [Wolinella succinogenes]CAE10858.1 ALDEHYDE FERREDOXIN OXIDOREDUCTASE [Wolinella succinogenes]VEG81015.1 putative oxidoreductase [Wolinella succinogenes]HCZ18489.1 aldehyde ferredoxin oxidoreductase [Helicobacter sp.]
MLDKIYRVNMTTMDFSIEEAPAEWMGLGGRGLTSTIVAAEVDPECHPLGPNNKLVFAPGMLSGTSAANSGRNSCGAKSPLTGGIKESNVGGTSAAIMAKLGVKALIIEGMPKEGAPFYHLHITKEKVEFFPVPELVGKNNYEVLDYMLEKYHKKVAVMSIGTPGEMRMNLANISVKDPGGKLRSHGRGGMGAVMGSKKVKCITVDAESYNEITLANPEKFKEASKIFTKTLQENPISGQGLPAFGTNVLVNILNEAGGLPTRNFREGRWEFAENICGETMAENIKARGGKTTHGCHAGCVIQCSQIYNDADGNYLTSGFEYETIWAFGSNAGIQDLDQIAKIDALMDDLGVDSIETGVTLGIAVDAGIVNYGDGEKIYDLIKNDIAKGTPLGRILGGGTHLVGKLYGLVRVPTVKGQGMPAYEPRAVKGQGVTYATSTMGADHTAGYAVATNILNSGGYVDPLKKEGQIILSRNLQIATAAVDSTGMCIFVAFPLLDDPKSLTALVDMINARFGTSLTGDDVTNLGMKILKTERAFNLKAGLTPSDDRLPEFMKYESLPPHNVVWDFTNEELDSFWDF